jgi:hypothetical protein
MTRKINDDMIHAIRSKKDWKLNNTEVVQVAEDLERFADVYLHGNLIARYQYSSSTPAIMFFSRGSLWHSPTTFSRINALSCEFSSLKRCVLSKRKGDSYLIRESGHEREWELHDATSYACS